jgi:hypothetical protein
MPLLLPCSGTRSLTNQYTGAAFQTSEPRQFCFGDPLARSRGRYRLNVAKKQKATALLGAEIETEMTLTGRVGAQSDGYDVRCKLVGDQLMGRIGSPLYGCNFRLDIADDGLEGAVLGVRGFAVSLKLAGGELVGLVGNESLVLRGVDTVTGVLGNTIVGLEIAARQNGPLVSGRIAGLLGKPFELEVGDIPGWMGVLVAVIGFYALEKHK